MSELDNVVDELWNTSEPYPVYCDKAKQAIQQLIDKEVQKAKVEASTFTMHSDDKKTWFTDNQLKEIEQLKDEAYRKGYNDNARDCYCDSPGATDGVLAHHHLMDDGKSYNIRPDIAELTKDTK